MSGFDTTTLDLDQSRSTDTGRTHPPHIGHLVMGLAFLGLASIWLAVEQGGVSVRELRWLLPLPWIVGGAAGLVAMLFAGRRRSSGAAATGYGAVPPPPERTDLFLDDSAADGLGSPAPDDPHAASDPREENPR